MSLDYAADHLLLAVREIACSEESRQGRLQTAWDEHVQHVWERPCLTRELLRDFKALWDRYTAPSTDRRSARLRELTALEAGDGIDEVVTLAVRTAVAAAQAPPDVYLARLSDLA